MEIMQDIFSPGAALLTSTCVFKGGEYFIYYRVGERGCHGNLCVHTLYVTVSEITDHLAPMQFVQYGPKGAAKVTK